MADLLTAAPEPTTSLRASTALELKPPTSPRSLQAGGLPPTPQTAGHARSKQLWYAAVFPELVNAEHFAAVQQRLCLHAQQFTSFVSLEPPNALLLEIRGSLKLLGPLERLHADIDACWRRLALPAYSATAPSTLGALWLARGNQARAGPVADTPVGGHPVIIEDLGTLPGHLARLPIACTAWESERLQTLRAVGVTRMAELLRLPRAGLARRLGTAAVQDLDIALARQFAPRRAFVPRERFRACCDFETEIETVAYLEKALEPLIVRCARFLRELAAGVQTLRLKLRHRTGPATRVHLGLASITSERRRLMDVLAQKLMRLELVAPVRGMELISGALQPLSAGSLDVFDGLAGNGGRDTAPQLVERLRARLGEEAVYGIAAIPEHRPEAAWRRVHELSLSSARRAGEKIPGRSAGDGMPRPLWLLSEPLPLREPDMPEEHPIGHPSDLLLKQGPERIESGWWDGKGVARDYYVAYRICDARHCEGRTPKQTPAGRPKGAGHDGPHQCAGREPTQTPVGRPKGAGHDGPHQSQGAKLWVFQERQSKRWYLHGMFA